MYFASPLRSLSLERKHVPYPEWGLFVLTPAAPRLGKALQKSVREDAAEARR